MASCDLLGGGAGGRYTLAMVREWPPGRRSRAAIAEPERLFGIVISCSTEGCVRWGAREIETPPEAYWNFGFHIGLLECRVWDFQALRNVFGRRVLEK